jgi:hypothetical protein
MPSKVFGVRKQSPSRLGSHLHDGRHEPKAEQLNAFRYDWLLRGCKRTFSPFHRGVVTTYALEVSAAGDGDYWDHSLSAFRAVRCLIHGTLPIFQPLTRNSGFCSDQRVRSRHARVANARGPSTVQRRARDQRLAMSVLHPDSGHVGHRLIPGMFSLAMPSQTRLRTLRII